MRSRTTSVPRGQKGKSSEIEGPNWILIAGGALLSTLSIRLGFKLKQKLDLKQQANYTCSLKGKEKPSNRRSTGVCHMHSNMYSFTQDEDGCFNCLSGNEAIADLKRQSSDDQLVCESDVALPLVTVASPDQLELPLKPFHQSNCSDSPRVSDSGSDIFSKREVIQRLRQQLKKRDDMIMEMQGQILDLQNSLNAQVELSTNLQSQLDAVNRELFDSEREIQQLRKAIANHCVANGKPSTAPIWLPEVTNGHSNGYMNGDSGYVLSKKGSFDMLKREVGELKEIIQGKEYLLQSYKEQKAELSLKVKELQQRLDCQLPNIL